MTSAINTIVVTLDLQLRSIPTLLERVNSIVTAMGDNKATFPSPTPSLATVTADVAALVAAQTAFKNRTGTRADRDAKKKAVVADAAQLHGYVQQVVNADPENAATIAAQASMVLRRKGSKSKPALAVHQTVSGTVHVVAKATKGARINEWQYSTDGGKSWTDLLPTTRARTVITGLTPGVNVSYRQRAVTKDGRLDWCQDITVLVT